MLFLLKLFNIKSDIIYFINIKGYYFLKKYKSLLFFKRDMEFV